MILLRFLCKLLSILFWNMGFRKGYIFGLIFYFSAIYENNLWLQLSCVYQINKAFDIGLTALHISKDRLDQTAKQTSIQKQHSRMVDVQ